jgi:hypothetical protein
MSPPFDAIDVLAPEDRRLSLQTLLGRTSL